MAEAPLEFNIPLDAPLEVQNENTVVSAAHPTFLSKPFSKYNNLLGNSVKYEGEGWFIDWKRIDLLSKKTGSMGVTPPAFSVVSFQRFGSIIFVRFDDGLSFWANLFSNPPLPAGVTSIVNENGNIIVTGIPWRGATIDLTIRARDLLILTQLPGVNARAVLNNGEVVLSINAISNSDDWIRLTGPSAEYTWSGEPFPLLRTFRYRYDGNAHVFDDIFRLTTNPDVIISLDPLINITYGGNRNHVVFNKTSELFDFRVLKSFRNDEVIDYRFHAASVIRSPARVLETVRIGMRSETREVERQVLFIRNWNTKYLNPENPNEAWPTSAGDPSFSFDAEFQVGRTSVDAGSAISFDIIQGLELSGSSVVTVTFSVANRAVLIPPGTSDSAKEGLETEFGNNFFVAERTVVFTYKRIAVFSGNTLRVGEGSMDVNTTGIVTAPSPYIDSENVSTYELNTKGKISQANTDHTQYRWYLDSISSSGGGVDPIPNDTEAAVIYIFRRMPTGNNTFQTPEQARASQRPIAIRIFPAGEFIPGALLPFETYTLESDVINPTLKTELIDFGWSLDGQVSIGKVLPKGTLSLLRPGQPVTGVSRIFHVQVKYDFEIGELRLLSDDSSELVSSIVVPRTINGDAGLFRILLFLSSDALRRLRAIPNFPTEFEIEVNFEEVVALSLSSVQVVEPLVINGNVVEPNQTNGIVISNISKEDFDNDKMPPFEGTPKARMYQAVVIDYSRAESPNTFVWMKWQKGTRIYVDDWRLNNILFRSKEVSAYDNFSQEFSAEMQHVTESIVAKLTPVELTASNGIFNNTRINNVTQDGQAFFAQLSNHSLRMRFAHGSWDVATLGWVIEEDRLLNRLVIYQAERLSIAITPPGIYGSGAHMVTSLGGPPLRFRYSNTDYTLNISDNAANETEWISEDIRTNETRVLRKAESDSEWIVCESHWASELEKDCWVVDENTIIVLGYIDEISLYKKTGNKDIFTTFEWVKEDSVPRSGWDLGRRYGISSAINDIPFIWKIDHTIGGLILQYASAPDKSLPEKLSWTTVRIPVRQERHLESLTLSTSNSISAPAPFITAEELWNVARFSATNKNGELWFGIAVDKAVKQWTLKITGTTFTVVNGFGFVGLDGTLTGGQYPTECVGSSGLAVPLKRLSDIVIDIEKNTTDFETITGTFLSNGALYFTNSFDDLCYAIDSDGNKVTMPAHGHFAYKKIPQTFERSTSEGAMIEILPMHWVGRIVTLMTGSSAYTEVVSTTWKTFNDISNTEQEYAIQEEAERRPDPHSKNYRRAVLGAALAGAASNVLTAENQAHALGGATVDLILDTSAMFKAKADKLATAVSPQRSHMALSDFYSVSQQSHIWAGPGFVQTQLVKSASLCGFGFTHMKIVREGVGFDPKQLIVVPGGFFAGFATGVGSLFSPFGTPQFLGYSSGLFTDTFGRQLPYRKYGYSHRYVNYPTEHEHTHSTKDFSVVIEEDKELMGDGEWTIAFFVSHTEEIAREFRNRSSFIEGSVLDGRNIDNAKRSTQNNTDMQFTAPYIYDYCVYPPCELFISAIDQEIVYVSVRDTKVLDGPPSNIVIKNGNVYIGSPYCALEILNPTEYDIELLRPRAVTPNTLLLNSTGINCIHGDRTYHACDAYSNRTISGSGVFGGKELQNSIFTFRADDDFKLSSLFPPMSLFGQFTSAFGIAYRWPIEMHSPFYRSLKSAAEVKEAYRFSVPVIYNRLAILPAAMKTLAAYKLGVIEGVTSLTTDLRSTTENARRPDALEFPIYGQLFRWNPEYISAIVNRMGVQVIQDLVATIGLKYIGATPDSAWFYSEAMRSFYMFAPISIQKVFNADRFQQVFEGTYDFVEQSVVVLTETKHGKRIIRNEKGQFVGEIVPPNETIGPYESYSMAGGMVFQGNRRFQINRFLVLEDMISDIKSNMGRWNKPRIRQVSDFWKKRDYLWEFNFDRAPFTAINRWFLEDYPLATSLLGIDDYVESKFEWLINFAVSDIILELWKNKYLTVYVAAETMTVGGLIRSELQKVRLHKKLFTRDGQYGYYSYRFNANNGLGDSERLYLWTDGPLLLRSLKLLATGKTARRISAIENDNETRDMEEL